MGDVEFLKPEGSPASPPKRVEAKKQSQFAQRRSVEGQGRKRSVFSQVSVEESSGDESQGVESVTSIASSASDEEINTLEKNLDVDENEDLAMFPAESLNILSKVLIFANPPSQKKKSNYKVSHGVVNDQSFAFNTELLAVERHELVRR